jgi:hypothetical protein
VIGGGVPDKNNSSLPFVTHGFQAKSGKKNKTVDNWKEERRTDYREHLLFIGPISNRNAMIAVRNASHGSLG